MMYRTISIFLSFLFITSHVQATFTSSDDLEAARKLRRSICDSLDSSLKESLKLKVAIIGAGISGLYSGFRLTADEGSPYKPGEVHIFEMGNRIGGRLESINIEESNLVGELGGMRYLTSQKIAATLIQNFELPSEDFPMGDDEESQSRLVAHYRGEYKKANEWTKAQQSGQKLATRYFLKGPDVGLTADQLFNKVIYEVLIKSAWFSENYGSKVSKKSEYDYEFNLTRQDWDDIKLNITYDFDDSPYTGIKLNNLGFWNVLKDRISQEGYNFLSDAGGYYSNTINWNAAEALPYMIGDFTDNPKYYTIKGGFDLIAYKLAEKFLNQEGNKIWTENKLLTFKHAKDGSGYILKFWNIKNKKPWVVQAENIILAMPRRSLELLDQQNFFFQDEKLQFNIRSVVSEPSFKVLLAFASPWWREDHSKPIYGHSITDLPMRQCYYFQTDLETQHSLMLASYNDMATVPFWSALSMKPNFTISPSTPSEHEIFKGPTYFDPPKVFNPNSDEKTILSTSKQSHYACSKVMIKELMKQLSELHPGVAIPKPYQALYKDWTTDPYGGGYHAWQAHYKVRDVVSYMRKPLSKETVFISGEAYSNQQGWIEGGFCVTEKMLQDHFGLEWPRWLEKDYYLGW